MALKLQIVNPMDQPSWDERLLANKGYSFFHSSPWARVLCESYGYNPLYFTLTDGPKLLVSVPVMEISSLLTGRRGVSLPFSDYCEPIISADIRFEDVLESLITHGRKAGWRSIEIRGAGELLDAEPANASYYEHTLDISKGEKEILTNIKSSTKRNIKKASKEGLEVKLENSLESIKEFYRLNCITRKRHGLPPQPYYFFKLIYNHVISKGHGVVALAYHKGSPIAGAVYFHFGEKAIYKYGASDKKYQNLRANDLVMWEAIKWYNKNNYKSFSFGRTDPENSGLLQFKGGWGASERTIRYYKYDLKKNAFLCVQPKVSRICNRVLNNTPAPLLKIVGSLLYRHMG